MFATCVDALASKGRLIIIGMMSQYGSGWAPSSYPGLTGEGRGDPGGCVSIDSIQRVRPERPCVWV